MIVRTTESIRKAWSTGQPASTMELTADCRLRDAADVEVLLLRAGALIEVSRYREAQALLRRVLDLVPESGRHLPQSCFGHLYSAKGDYAKAEGWYRLASESRDGRPYALLPLADTQSRQGKLDEATQTLRLAGRFAALSDRATLALGEAWLARGDLARAKRSFERMGEDSPLARHARNRLRDLEEAAATRHRDASADPDDASAIRRELHRILRDRRRDRPLTAATRCEAYLDRHPSHWFVWMIHGDMLTELGRFDEARKALRRAIRLAPEDLLPEAHSFMGHLQRAQGRYGQAARWHEKAIEGDPSRTCDHLYAGAARVCEGRFDEAEKHYRRALEQKQATEEACLNIGYVKRARREYREAEYWFQRAVDADPKLREAKRALRDVRKALGTAEPSFASTSAGEIP